MSLEQMRKDIANVVYICERLGKTIETYQAVYDDKKRIIDEKDQVIRALRKEIERLQGIISVVLSNTPKWSHDPLKAPWGNSE